MLTCGDLPEPGSDLMCQGTIRHTTLGARDRRERPTLARDAGVEGGLLGPVPRTDEVGSGEERDQSYSEI